MKKIKLLLVMMLLVGCQSPSLPLETKKEEEKVSFLAVGDNIMHKQLIDKAKQGETYEFLPYYTHMQSYIKEADVSFINQETILGGRNFKYSGYPLFNTPDEMAGTLHELGFDIVNGSTNHAFDMNEKAVDHSIQLFKRYKDMKYIGLYQSKEEQKKVPVIEKNGIRIALLSYNQYVNYDQKPSEYRYNNFDKTKMKEDVERAKKVSDVIVVSCHWGKEYDTKPNDFQKKFAQYLTDLGVDVIIGTHTHTLQSVEWLDGKDGHKTLVAYSLGNFISGMLEEETQLGGMLSFDFKKDNGKVNIENITLTPLVNHFYAENQRNIIGTRYGFTVYRLKDYTDELAKQHGVYGYQNSKISIKTMKEKVNQRISPSIHIDM
ncbi:MAG: CapA family protein [Coprobacillus sp.]|nr:CapA family protein [Coprobacillus sp.]